MNIMISHTFHAVIIVFPVLELCSMSVLSEMARGD